MPNFIDLTGQIFSRLTVSKKAENIGQKTAWFCICSCGSKLIVTSTHLKSGDTQSCGCYHHDELISRNTTHNMSHSREFKSWAQAINRCTNKSSPDYANYGERGISVCSRWSGKNGFHNFYFDMGSRPKNTSIERKNNYAGYSPGNCCWATRAEQNNNKRSNINLTYNGKTQTAKQWARELSIYPQTLYARLNRGWTTYRALSTPIRKGNYSKKPNK